MNFIDDETPQKLRGGYYTPPDIAACLARWVLGREVGSLLEPSAGDGAFVRALGTAGRALPRRMVACEADAAEAARVEAAARELGLPAEVVAGDFLAWALEHLDEGPRFDAVLGNPPFVRYQYLDAALQRRAERIIRRFGLRFTRHTNLWVPFVVASLALLRPGGRLGLVVPAELLHVLHAASARRFLLDSCTRILVVDPEEIWFEDTLQGAVLLLAERGEARGPGEVAVLRVRGRAFLDEDPEDLFRHAPATPGSELPGKWMRALLSPRERSLLAGLAEHPRVARFSDVATVAVGIVTGANRFFLVPDATVEAWDLHDFAHPMFGRSSHVSGVIHAGGDQARNAAAGLPAHFLWLDAARADLPPGARRYVEEGERQGLHTRYKCRVREPWYTVPSVYAAPVAMLKRCHDLPRLILNRAGAFTTDTAYRVVPAGPEPADLVAAFVNSITALSAELEGRHYGGGVLELVPSEVRRLLVPRPEGEMGLETLDAALRAGMPPGEVLASRDRALLAPLGLGPADAQTLREAWWKLRNRRHRAS